MQTLLKDPRRLNELSNPERQTIASLDTETIPAVKPEPISESGIYPYNNPCPGWHPQPTRSLLDRLAGIDLERLVGRLVLIGLGLFALAVAGLFTLVVGITLLVKVVGMVMAIK